MLVLPPIVPVSLTEVGVTIVVTGSEYSVRGGKSQGWGGWAKRGVSGGMEAGVRRVPLKKGWKPPPAPSAMGWREVRAHGVRLARLPFVGLAFG